MSFEPNRETCPKCDSENMRVTFAEVSEGEATIKVRCGNCELVFYEIYEFCGYKLDTCFPTSFPFPS